MFKSLGENNLSEVLLACFGISFGLFLSWGLGLCKDCTCLRALRHLKLIISGSRISKFGYIDSDLLQSLGWL